MHSAGECEGEAGFVEEAEGLTAKDIKFTDDDTALLEAAMKRLFKKYGVSNRTDLLTAMVREQFGGRKPPRGGPKAAAAVQRRPRKPVDAVAKAATKRKRER